MRTDSMEANDGRSAAAAAAAAAVAAAAAARLALVSARIAEYAAEYSTAGRSDDFLAHLTCVTAEVRPTQEHMLSGPLQARMLVMFAQLSRARRVLDIGTFTGYSAVALASALPADGLVVTIERDEDIASVAQDHIAKLPPGLARIELLRGDAQEIIENRLRHAEDGFDMIFVDANKLAYEKYYDSIFREDSALLNAHGVAIFDNVLYRGQVVNAADGSSKASKIGMRLHEFNRMVLNDQRTTNVLVPVRDGLLIVQKVSRRQQLEQT